MAHTPGTTLSGTTGRKTSPLTSKRAAHFFSSCHLTHFGNYSRNVKVFIGAPASSSAAGSGYVPIATLQSIAQGTRKNFPVSFGGVMFWDASQSYANGRYDVATKSALTSGGSCSGGYTLQACTAAAWSSTASYPTGSTVRCFLHRVACFSSLTLIWINGRCHTEATNGMPGTSRPARRSAATTRTLGERSSNAAAQALPFLATPRQLLRRRPRPHPQRPRPRPHPPRPRPRPPPLAGRDAPVLPPGALLPHTPARRR